MQTNEYGHRAIMYSMYKLTNYLKLSHMIDRAYMNFNFTRFLLKLQMCSANKDTLIAYSTIRSSVTSYNSSSMGRITLDYTITEATLSRDATHWLRLNYDVSKWKHSPRRWPFVRGIHQSPMNSPHKSQ